jgi:hypothetical protein
MAIRLLPQSSEKYQPGLGISLSYVIQRADFLPVDFID